MANVTRLEFASIKDPNTEWISEQCATAFQIQID